MTWNKKPEDILSDFEAGMALLWKGGTRPQEIFLPKQQAAELGVDVSNIPDGAIVVIRQDGSVEEVQP